MTCCPLPVPLRERVSALLGVTLWWAEVKRRQTPSVAYGISFMPTITLEWPELLSGRYTPTRLLRASKVYSDQRVHN